MSAFQINDHLLTRECDGLAADIFAEIVAELDEGDEPSDKRDEMDYRARETVDAHEWVIDNFKALMICAHCDTSEGESFLDDIGFQWVQGESTIYTVATSIVYGEMRARVMAEIDQLIDAWEPAEAA